MASPQMIHTEEPRRPFGTLVPNVFICTAVVLMLFSAFGAGALWHRVYSRQTDAQVVDELWRKVEKYNAHLKNPGNLERDASLGMNFVRPLFDPEPLLAELVSRGELRHYDIVFPTVPRDAKLHRHWMMFCQTHPEIVEATSSEPAFRISGRQPMTLDLWVKKDNEALVQQLIDELEAMASQAAPGS